jgi:hypothetical protein
MHDDSEDALAPLRIDPDGIYPEGHVRILLGLSERKMNRARRTHALQWNAQGRQRFYLGQWILNWLHASSVSRCADAEKETLP